MFPGVLSIVPLLALPALARPAPLRPKPVTQPVVLQLTGIRCSVCIQSVRRALAHFPGVLNPQFDVPREQVRLRVKPGFDQYAKLKEAVEAGGGEIKMFHAAYLVPQPLYTTLGVRDLQDDKLDRLRRRLGAVPGVRAAIIDPSRWFTNDQGLDVGGAVVFSDPDPRLEKNLERAASQAGFSLETRMDDPAAMHEQEFGVMNHRITGLLLLLLTGLGVLQITASQPPSWVRYGSLAVWLGLFVFIALRADPEYWPLGAINWLEGFKDRECCQHRLGAALLIPLIGGDFLRLRHGWTLNPTLAGWGILALGVVGGGMLFTHRHTTLDPAHAEMVRRMNAQHMAMAASVLGLGVTRFAWDRWKVPRGWGQYLWLICLGSLGLFLNLYTE